LVRIAFPWDAEIFVQQPAGTLSMLDGKTPDDVYRDEEM
jgi:hypothetical protein